MPSVSIVVPVRDEAANMGPLFEQLARDVSASGEVLIVFDSDDDPTVPAARAQVGAGPFAVRLVRNDLGRGPANAIRAGFEASKADAVVVVMADLSDQLTAIDRMLALMQDGYDLVVGSRYMRGGKQVGGPIVKRTLSRLAGLILFYGAGLPTHDATNAFKMYRTELLRKLDVEGGGGFEISLELTVKAWLAGWRITEIPTTWTDRVAGGSKFRLLKWLPRYLHWFFYALRGRWLPSSGNVESKD
jgi:glycosyltransferase involved in cell wall biosynthesis